MISIPKISELNRSQMIVAGYVGAVVIALLLAVASGNPMKVDGGVESAPVSLDEEVDQHDNSTIPKLGGAFSDASRIQSFSMMGMEGQTFATSDSFEKIRREFEAYLGEEWTQAPLTREDVKRKSQFFSKEDIEALRNMALYQSDIHPGVLYGISEIGIPVEGHSAMVSMTKITVPKAE